MKRFIISLELEDVKHYVAHVRVLGCLLCSRMMNKFRASGWIMAFNTSLVGIIPQRYNKVHFLSVKVSSSIQ
jgi:hypothetical protein